MTDLIDRADSGEIPTGDPTINLASHAYRLRHHEERQRINPAYLHSAETIILDVSGQPYRQPTRITPLGHGADAWIFDLDGELHEPPTGNPPPLPPTPPTPAKAERRVRFRHRRRLDRLVAGILIGATAVTAALIGVDVAAAWVMGVIW